jgi:hypothetical protein
MDNGLSGLKPLNKRQSVLPISIFNSGLKGRHLLTQGASPADWAMRLIKALEERNNNSLVPG